MRALEVGPGITILPILFEYPINTRMSGLRPDGAAWILVATVLGSKNSHGISFGVPVSEVFHADSWAQADAETG